MREKMYTTVEVNAIQHILEDLAYLKRCLAVLREDVEYVGRLMRRLNCDIEELS